MRGDIVIVIIMCSVLYGIDALRDLDRGWGVVAMLDPHTLQLTVRCGAGTAFMQQNNL